MHLYRYINQQFSQYGFGKMADQTRLPCVLAHGLEHVPAKLPIFILSASQTGCPIPCLGPSSVKTDTRY